MPDAMTELLLPEYEAIVNSVGADAADESYIAVLMADADWTEHGAREVLLLARTYGVSILRSALALATAMGIEDGDAGL